MTEAFIKDVLACFSNINKEIDLNSSEFDIRDRIVLYLVRNLLGYSGKEYQVEKSKTDLTLFDENGFRVVVI